jgi:hypothetical protein
MSIKVLCLAANPLGTSPLQLAEEIRDIQDYVHKALHRDALDVVSRLAVRPDDLVQAMVQYRPDIVHFSGHGTKAGQIVLCDADSRPKPVCKEALVSLFTVFKENIKVIVLSACYSQVQAEAIIQHIPCVVGMSEAVGDKAAITFATSFYRAIGSGYSVRSAFDQGVLALQLEGIPETGTPVLLCGGGVKADEVVLIDGAQVDGQEPPGAQRQPIGRTEPTSGSINIFGRTNRIGDVVGRDQTKVIYTPEKDVAE